MIRAVDDPKVEQLRIRYPPWRQFLHTKFLSSDTIYTLMCNTYDLQSIYIIHSQSLPSQHRVWNCYNAIWSCCTSWAPVAGTIFSADTTIVVEGTHRLMHLLFCCEFPLALSQYDVWFYTFIKTHVTGKFRTTDKQWINWQVDLESNKCLHGLWKQITDGYTFAKWNLQRLWIADIYLSLIHI